VRFAGVLLCWALRFCYNRGMRVTGGEFRGRRLAVPAGDKVRPTQDRVREALFSMLLHAVPDAVFVDLYAGSGAVGLEALSRGARRVVWVEANPRHVACLTRNRDTLAPERGEIVRADVLKWCGGGGRGLAADVVFADPPYAEAPDAAIFAVMRLCAEHRVLAQSGMFVAEMSSSGRAQSPDGWELLKDRVYGQTRLAVYQRAEGEVL
jgi:16S rRNA (guanine966-N2)-methyltransferase